MNLEIYTRFRERIGTDEYLLSVGTVPSLADLMDFLNWIPWIEGEIPASTNPELYDVHLILDGDYDNPMVSRNEGELELHLRIIAARYPESEEVLEALRGMGMIEIELILGFVILLCLVLAMIVYREGL